MSSPSLEDLIMCPVCHDPMKTPILQCKTGHSMCGSCVKDITNCPYCREQLCGMRNYQLEQLIEGLQNTHVKLNCAFFSKGCKFAVSTKDKEYHESECKFRRFQCEGKKFAKWSCNWSGDYSEIHPHFLESHRDHTRMEFKTDATMKVNLKVDFNDIQIISFFNGQHYFYYKHRIDCSQKKAYWAFQVIGLRNQGQHFSYEFEILNGPRKLKVTELCSSDATDINDVFKKEKCFVVSFTTLKHYLNEEGELPFKFRIMSNKKGAKF